MIRYASSTVLVLALVLGGPSGPSAQDKAPPPSTAPSPAEKNPLSTTTDPNPSTKPGEGTAMPRPDKSLAPPVPSGAAPPGSSKAPAPQTLVPMAADATDVEEVTLPARPAAILPAKAKKDDAAGVLKETFARLGEALSKAGIKTVGRPLAVFTNVDENELQFDAMIPIEAAPAQTPTGVEGLRIGTTPSGKGFRFRHLGAYDEISGTYEVFSAYLDLKEASVRDEFIEEYVTDLKDGSDESLDVNIYALRK